VQPQTATPEGLVQNVNAFLAEMSPAGSPSEISGGDNDLPAWAITHKPVQSAAASPSSTLSGGQSPPAVAAKIPRKQSSKPRRKAAAAKGKKKGKGRNLAVKSPTPKRAAAKRQPHNRVRIDAAYFAESRAAGVAQRATRSNSQA
jgi:hypothetical protein